MASDGAVVAVVAGGLVLAGGYAWWRWREEQERLKEEKSKDPCELLRLAGGTDAQVAACKAGVAIGEELLELVDDGLDAIITGQKEDYDKANAALNGPVVDGNALGYEGGVSEEYWKQGQHVPLLFTPNSAYGQSGGGMSIRGVGWKLPRHENGCIPCVGLRVSAGEGWHKCKEGTRSYTDLSETRPVVIGDAEDEGGQVLKHQGYRRPFTGSTSPDNARDWQARKMSLPEKEQGWYFRRQIPDLFTHPHWKTGLNAPNELKFPLALSGEQVGWWVMGQPFVAPKWAVGDGRAYVPVPQVVGGDGERKRLVGVTFEPEPASRNAGPSPAPPVGPPVSPPPPPCDGRRYVWMDEERQRFEQNGVVSAPPYWRRAKYGEEGSHVKVGCQGGPWP